MLVVTFAAGMAWVEAACVYYLRVMVDRVEPYQPDPLPIRGILGEVELVREGATLLMLAMTGMLAGRSWRARLGYAAIAFGGENRGEALGLRRGARDDRAHAVIEVPGAAFEHGGRIPHIDRDIGDGHPVPDVAR